MDVLLQLVESLARGDPFVNQLDEKLRLRLLLNLYDDTEPGERELRRLIATYLYIFHTRRERVELEKQQRALIAKERDAIESDKASITKQVVLVTAEVEKKYIIERGYSALRDFNPIQSTDEESKTIEWIRRKLWFTVKEGPEEEKGCHLAEEPPHAGPCVKLKTVPH